MFKVFKDAFAGVGERYNKYASRVAHADGVQDPVQDMQDKIDEEDTAGSRGKHKKRRSKKKKAFVKAISQLTREQEDEIRAAVYGKDGEYRKAMRAHEAVDRNVENLRSRIEEQSEGQSSSTAGFRSQRLASIADTTAMPCGQKWFVEIDAERRIDSERKQVGGGDKKIFNFSPELASPQFDKYVEEWRASAAVSDPHDVPSDCSHDLQPGCFARVGRLQSSVDLNGKVVKLDHWDEGKQRWIVQTHLGNKAVRTQNLTRVSPTDPMNKAA